MKNTLMILNDNIKHLQMIYNRYGYSNQCMKLVEECRELDTAIHSQINTDMADEIADVLILCLQLCNAKEIGDKVPERINYKITRQLERIREGK